MEEIADNQQLSPNVLERCLNALAAGQYGYLTRRQLLSCRLTPGAIAYRQRSGRLVRVHQGVYSLGPPRLDPPAQAAAAVLACSPGATLSHSSAAFLWGLMKAWTAPPEVTTTRDRRHQGITVHVSTTLAGRDVRTHLGIRMTSAARALLEIAPRLSTRERTRAYSDARHARRLYPAELAEILTRLPRHPGAIFLRPLVEDRAGPTRSDFEDAFRAFVTRFGLPEPLINARVAGYEVDALFPRHNVIVELDSWEFHQGHPSFESDRDRDAALLAGYVTVRITWERLMGQSEREAERLHAILAQRQYAS